MSIDLSIVFVLKNNKYFLFNFYVTYAQLMGSEIVYLLMLIEFKKAEINSLHKKSRQNLINICQLF